MNPYYTAGPPPPAAPSPNGFYNGGYSRRQHGPPAHPMGQPSMQPNPYAPPFVPIAALPTHSSPLNTPRPPMIVSSTYFPAPAPISTPPLPPPHPPPPHPPHPAMHMQMSSHIMPPQPIFPNSVPFQPHYEYQPPPPPVRVVRKIPNYPLPGTLPWLSNPDEPFPERPRRKKRIQTLVKEKESQEQEIQEQEIKEQEITEQEVKNENASGNKEDKNEKASGSNEDIKEASVSESQPIITVAIESTKEAVEEVDKVVVNGTSALSDAIQHTTDKVPEDLAPQSDSSELQVPKAAEVTPVSPASIAPLPPQEAPAPQEKTEIVVKSEQNVVKPEQNGDVDASKSSTETTQETTPLQTVPPVPAAPKSWADLVKSKPKPGGNIAPIAKPNGAPTKASLSDILKNFDGAKLSLSVPILEPRGIKNTGNMCYMNAILQVLIFCAPFYNFLDMLGKNMTHSFKGNTPLLDTMIELLREFRVLGDKSSIEKLHGFKAKEYLESFGDPFTPELLYKALKDIQRFASMRRGHQQDAEEFLGFLLDELHEEIVRVIKASTETAVSSPAMSEVSDDGWLEVGPKQKTASTRTTTIIESPITKIFGGKLRSEFKITGSKASVTLEPYQPLQLDIQSPQVQNIVDALKQLTKPEVIHGDFKGKNGANTTATKTVYIETLPPVLILHLKRFQYDNKGGTQKIWKKIGYPLILDFPKEALSPGKRQTPPIRFKLTGVVYHHGKSASGGHYTVDVLRQDEKNWIRLDDTTIKKVHADEVKVDVKDINSGFSDKADDDAGWESVGNGTSDYAGAVNGNVNYNKDSRVAYILFYQRI